MSLEKLFELTPHGIDVVAGEGFPYPWGGLYGGHIVAQSLRAASSTVEEGFLPHSVRAYFIRRGDNTETVRYEVDRIRNGRSFCTRRVVARQSNGAILNLEASYQLPEGSPEISSVAIASNIPQPDDLAPADTWSPHIEQREIPLEFVAAEKRDGSGQLMSWYRVKEDFGDDQLMHRCALAYLSDDLPTGAVIRGVPELRERWNQENAFFSASLDHTIWFHRDIDSSQWHLYEMNCHAYINGRGLAFGYVFAQDGTHVATVAQETLVRLREQ
jgi:acyl-CoA thioesterase-2